MAFDLTMFNESARQNGYPPIDPAYLERQLELAATDAAVRFERLMAYYRNDLRELAGPIQDGESGESARPYVQAQEFGLPPRITGFRHDGYGAGSCGEGSRVESIRRKEVVIENDIGWRVDAMVHYLFGRPVHIASLAADPNLRQRIDTVINAALERNGGPLFLKQLALMGHVYGFVDVLLRVEGPRAEGQGSREGPRPEGQGTRDKTDMNTGTPSDLGPRPSALDPRPSSRIVLELVEADRAGPILNDADFRRIDYYVQHFRQRCNRVDGGGLEESVMVTEVLGPHAWQRYVDRKLVAAGPNPLGRIPVVHIQNLPRPFCYEGHGEVERLVPMQDELNTRLSDRANRITFQSFRMYLGRGIENFENRPVAPGRMWSADNPDASIQEFGGDGGAPSEDAHIEQVREAMDKISGVPPVAGGVVRDRLGNLSSGTALRLTLGALLSKTSAKRATYGAGIEQVCELVLAWLDATGELPTRPEDRRVRIAWPPMLPESETEAERLQAALLKRQLGVPADRVLAELGYGPGDSQEINHGGTEGTEGTEGE